MFLDPEGHVLYLLQHTLKEVICNWANYITYPHYINIQHILCAGVYVLGVNIYDSNRDRWSATRTYTCTLTSLMCLRSHSLFGLFQHRTFLQRCCITLFKLVVPQTRNKVSVVSESYISYALKSPSRPLCIAPRLMLHLMNPGLRHRNNF